MAYIYDIADTWAASGTVFTGIKLNVTDTASAAGSLLMDLQVGGVSQFSVNKSTGFSFRIGAKAVTFNHDYGLQLTTGSSFAFAIGTGAVAIMTATAWNVNTLAFGISTGSATLLQQDGSTLHTLAQRNGVNAQAFNLYNTYTDASNYERGFMKWSANQLNIGAEAAGTGTARNIAFFAGAGGVNMLLGNGITRFYSNPEGASDNTYDLGTTTRYWRNLFQKGYHEVVEMTAPTAPATNGVRIYAEDNGAGKTRLMALFATGAAVQIAIEP